MTKVITYGTYDMLHYGHIHLLERAKALGDFLIVGVTSDDFDKARGKINVQQSLTERIEAVKATGLADQVIIEEYEGQKIDDLKRYDIDIFTVGSDWAGKFDYLREYCKVVYLDRTHGISSTELRAESRKVRIGLVGGNEPQILEKYYKECKFVNGAEVSGVCTSNKQLLHGIFNAAPATNTLEELMEMSDAFYIISHPSEHYTQVKKALEHGKHVLCESPIALRKQEIRELYKIADRQGLILMDAIKTAYGMAYNRLLLLLKSGKIGRIVSVDSTCTSMRNVDLNDPESSGAWNSICAWGPTGMLPVFQLLGTDYEEVRLASFFHDKACKYDLFTKMDFVYKKAVASVKVGRGVKSEGELIISGTEGYIYVPAPWWNTDYFEIRYEDPTHNKRYFYQLDGEGIRYELVAFLKSINTGRNNTYVERKVSETFGKVLDKFYNGSVYSLM